jgi:hypothetical protein
MDLCGFIIHQKSEAGWISFSHVNRIHCSGENNVSSMNQIHPKKIVIEKTYETTSNAVDKDARRNLFPLQRAKGMM